MRVDVLIVGAGPVGLTLATELARYGASVRIIEKAAERPAQSKGLFLWSRTLELLDRAGAADGLVGSGQKITAANIVAAGRTIAHLDFADIKTPFPYAVTLMQSEIEHRLEVQLARRGLAVERQTECLGFTDGADGITAELRLPGGTPETVQARYIVGCDGPSSIVRKTLGTGFDYHPGQTSWAVADVALDGLNFPPHELVSFWHEDGFLGLFPVGFGRYRVIADTSVPGEDHPPPPTLHFMQMLVERRGPGGLTLSEPSGLAAFRLQERNAKTYQSGHVFLAGDAAHLHSPAGGQGMNMGIHDAINLGWKLALVCRGIASGTGLLGSYHAERHAITEKVLADVGRLTAISVLKNQAAQATRNAIGNLLFGLAPTRRAITGRLSEVSLGYDNSPLNGNEDHALPSPWPGERVSPLPGQAPFGAGKTPLFALCAAASPATAKLLHDHAGLLEPDLRPELSPRCLWLVRPDGYVAAAVLEGDTAALGDYLASIRGKVVAPAM